MIKCWNAGQLVGTTRSKVIRSFFICLGRSSSVLIKLIGLNQRCLERDTFLSAAAKECLQRALCQLLHLFHPWSRDLVDHSFYPLHVFYRWMLFGHCAWTHDVYSCCPCIRRLHRASGLLCSSDPSLCESNRRHWICLVLRCKGHGIMLCKAMQGLVIQKLVLPCLPWTSLNRVALQVMLLMDKPRHENPRYNWHVQCGGLCPRLSRAISKYHQCWKPLAVLRLPL